MRTPAASLMGVLCVLVGLLAAAPHVAASSDLGSEPFSELLRLDCRGRLHVFPSSALVQSVDLSAIGEMLTALRATHRAGVAAMVSTVDSEQCVVGDAEYSRRFGFSAAAFIRSMKGTTQDDPTQCPALFGDDATGEWPHVQPNQFPRANAHNLALLPDSCTGVNGTCDIVLPLGDGGAAGQAVINMASCGEWDLPFLSVRLTGAAASHLLQPCQPSTSGVDHAACGALLCSRVSTIGAQASGAAQWWSDTFFSTGLAGVGEQLATDVSKTVGELILEHVYGVQGDLPADFAANMGVCVPPFPTPVSALGGTLGAAQLGTALMAVAEASVSGWLSMGTSAFDARKYKPTPEWYEGDDHYAYPIMRVPVQLGCTGDAQEMTLYKCHKIGDHLYISIDLSMEDEDVQWSLNSDDMCEDEISSSNWHSDDPCIPLREPQPGVVDSLSVDLSAIKVLFSGWVQEKRMSQWAVQPLGAFPASLIIDSVMRINEDYTLPGFSIPAPADLGSGLALGMGELGLALLGAAGCDAADIYVYGPAAQFALPSSHEIPHIAPGGPFRLDGEHVMLELKATTHHHRGWFTVSAGGEVTDLFPGFHITDAMPFLPHGSGLVLGIGLDDSGQFVVVERDVTHHTTDELEPGMFEGGHLVAPELQQWPMGGSAHVLLSAAYNRTLHPDETGAEHWFAVSDVGALTALTWNTDSIHVMEVLATSMCGYFHGRWTTMAWAHVNGHADPVLVKFSHSDQATIVPGVHMPPDGTKLKPIVAHCEFIALPVSLANDGDATTEDVEVGLALFMEYDNYAARTIRFADPRGPRQIMPCVDHAYVAIVSYDGTEVSTSSYGDDPVPLRVGSGYELSSIRMLLVTEECVYVSAKDVNHDPDNHELYRLCSDRDAVRMSHDQCNPTHMKALDAPWAEHYSVWCAGADTRGHSSYHTIDMDNSFTLSLGDGYDIGVLRQPTDPIGDHFVWVHHGTVFVGNKGELDGPAPISCTFATPTDAQRVSSFFGNERIMNGDDIAPPMPPPPPPATTAHDNEGRAVTLLSLSCDGGMSQFWSKGLLPGTLFGAAEGLVNPNQPLVRAAVQKMYEWQRARDGGEHLSVDEFRMRFNPATLDFWFAVFVTGAPDFAAALTSDVLSHVSEGVRVSVDEASLPSTCNWASLMKNGTCSLRWDGPASMVDGIESVYVQAGRCSNTTGLWARLQCKGALCSAVRRGVLCDDDTACPGTARCVDMHAAFTGAGEMATPRADPLWLSLLPPSYARSIRNDPDMVKDAPDTWAALRNMLIALGYEAKDVKRTLPLGVCSLVNAEPVAVVEDDEWDESDLEARLPSAVLGQADSFQSVKIGFANWRARHVTITTTSSKRYDDDDEGNSHTILVDDVLAGCVAPVECGRGEYDPERCACVVSAALCASLPSEDACTREDGCGWCSNGYCVAATHSGELGACPRGRVTVEHPDDHTSKKKKSQAWVIGVGVAVGVAVAAVVVLFVVRRRRRKRITDVELTTSLTAKRRE